MAVRSFFATVKDAHYPWKSLYPDFDAKPRWESHEAVKVTACPCSYA
jgi:hypothetical protein